MTYSRIFRAGLVLAVAAPLLVQAATDQAQARTRATVASLRPAERDELQRQIDDQLAHSKGGRQTAPNEITYPGAVMVFPLPGSDTAPAWSGDHRAAKITQDPDWHNCPVPASEPSYYCFYADANWGGRRLQFNLFHEDRPVDFADYGFRRMTSSWVNTARGLAVVVDRDAGGGKFELLWREEPQSMSSSVARNDMADRFWAVRA